MTQLQRQWQEMAAGEQKLADERLEMSRERLEMQATTRRLSQTRCSLCKIGDRTKELADMMTISEGAGERPNVLEQRFSMTDATDPVNFILDRGDTNAANWATRQMDMRQSIVSRLSSPMDVIAAGQMDDDDDLLLARFDAMKSSFFE